MSPVLKNKQLVLALRLFSRRRLKADDIVLFSHNDVEQIKRIKSVLSNGMILVEGDNKVLSEDSRHFGPIEAKSIFAKVLLVK